MYAIIQNGAHQYKVQAGAFLRVEKQKEAPGQLLTHDKVLAVSNKEGVLTFGEPYVEGAQVHFRVIRHGKSKKKLVFKKKRRKGYRRTQGHRQEFTEIYIETLSDSTGQKVSLPLRKKAEQKKAEQKTPEEQKQTPEANKLTTEHTTKANLSSQEEKQATETNKLTTEHTTKANLSSQEKTSPVSTETKQASKVSETELKKSAQKAEGFAIAHKAKAPKVEPKKEGV